MPGRRRRNSLASALAAVLALTAQAAGAEGAFAPVQFARPELAGPPPALAHPLARVCGLIAENADANGLPRAFFARLIWKESRFDPSAVSPVGAQGIAQFMPGTAAMRGLADSFDMAKAIPASAAYLAELAARFGNLGLAAAAYNSGEARVTRWLSKGGFLPLETEAYVLDIMGEAADRFATRDYRPDQRPLHPAKAFDTACRDLPADHGGTLPMARTPQLPWGIQVAGAFRQSVAVNQWEMLRQRHARVLAGIDPVISRVRSPRGRKGIFAVRIGAQERREADRICAELRRDGGACLVRRNR